MGEVDKWINKLSCSERTEQRPWDPEKGESNFPEKLGSLHREDGSISVRSVKTLNRDKNPR